MLESNGKECMQMTRTKKEDFTIGDHDSNWHYLILSMDGMRKHNIQSNPQLDEIYEKILEDADNWNRATAYGRVTNPAIFMSPMFQRFEEEVTQHKKKLEKVQDLLKYLTDADNYDADNEPVIAKLKAIMEEK